MSDISPRIAIAGEAWPEELTSREWWVLADPADKKPRAPWNHDGSDHAVKWNRNLNPEERPETTHGEAVRWSEFAEYSEYHPAIILPPEHENITLIDLDDVIRDGMISPPALEVLREAGGFAEVSSSGEGIHTFVRGHLPPALGRVIEYFDESDESLGQLEMYDHGRVCVMPGDHIEGSPLTIPDGQRVIDRLISEYVVRECEECGAEHLPPDLSDGHCADCYDGATDAEIERDRATYDSGGSRSPYFDHPVADVAEPEYASVHGNRIQGAHPGHGATSPGKADRNSSNFAVFESENYWRCFAHGTWGGALDLVAILEGFVRCSNFDTRWLDRATDQEFLDVCLAARDEYGFSGDPPYRALVAVAERENLAMADSEEGILGSNGYEIARHVYDRLHAP